MYEHDGLGQNNEGNVMSIAGRDFPASSAAAETLGYDGTLDVAGATLQASAVIAKNGRMIAACQVTTNIVAVAWQEDSTNDIYLQLTTYASGVGVPGTAIIAETTSAACNCIDLSVAPGGSKIWLAYGKNLGSMTGQIKTYTRSGTTLTLDATQDIGTTYTEDTPSVSICAVSDTRAHVTYIDTTTFKSRGVTAGSGTLALDAAATTIDGLTDSVPPCQQYLDATRTILQYGAGDGALARMKGQVITTSGATTSNTADKDLAFKIGATDATFQSKARLVFATGQNRGLSLGDYSLDSFTIASNDIAAAGTHMLGQGYFGSMAYITTSGGIDYYMAFTHTQSANTGYMVRGVAFDSTNTDKLMLSAGSGEFQGIAATYANFCRANAIVKLDSKRAVAVYPAVTTSYPTGRIINWA
jgi:hypothetical protein